MNREKGTMINKTLLPALLLALALGFAACGSDDEGSASSGSGGGGGEKLSGKIAIDGSSTVAPFTQAAAELFNEENPDVQITVGTSGTGGGFEKFCAGETDISDASRPIKDDEEVPICEKNGVKYGEVQVANDGIAVVTNKALKVDCLATDQLNLVGVDAGDGCVKPSPETIQDGSYKPLSRPLFMYPASKAITRPEVKAFMDFVIANQSDIAEAAKIVPLTEEQASKAKSDLQAAEQ